uniref:Uncharacterized protein n=1 Tax=Rhizophora mucronata TaxID=61149 RepID=A0A2P2L3L1_RHIMU
MAFARFAAGSDMAISRIRSKTRSRVIKSGISILPQFLVLCLLSTCSTSSPADAFTENVEGTSDYLYKEILRDEAIARLNELGKVLAFLFYLRLPRFTCKLRL